MEKILTAIENHADDGPRAADIYFETANMDKRELAEYVATHKDELRELLGVRDLADKDGSPELTKEFWDMVKLGNSIQNPDPYQRHDYYGEDLKSVDSYMEDFGVQKEGGEYSDDMRAAFTNKDNPGYFGNFDRDMVTDLALREGLTYDEYIDRMKRSTDEWQRGNQARGYDADNGITWRWFTDLGQEIAFPRIREKKLAGLPATWEDYLGDIAEAGLNFVPGVGILNKLTGKVVAKLPETLGFISRLGIEGLESAAVPLGSQALDVALYSDDDPRGQWDWQRVGTQYGGAVGAKGAIKMLGRTAKDAASLRSGKAGEQKVRNAMEVIEDIGYDARNSIEKRGLAQQRMAELSKDANYMDFNGRTFMSPEQNKTGLFLGPEEGKAYMDFVIKKNEAERLAKSQGARTALAEQQRAYNNELKRIGEGSEKITDPNKKVKYIEDRLNEAEDKYDLTKPYNEFQVLNRSDKDIVQLPDGRFAYAEGGVIGGLDGSPKWQTNFMGQPDELPPKVIVLKQFDDPVSPKTETYKVGKVKQEVTEAPRDIVVRKELNKDKDFSSVASGRARWNKPVNTATNFAFNAAAREGIVGQGLDLDEKRQAALYNQMLTKLRPVVAESGKTPEGKRRAVDAVMNVLTYGLDNLPEEMYKKDKATYKAIAKQLGSADWSHWSDHKVPDQPTTSY